MKKQVLSLCFLVFVAVQISYAQTYYISTIAGKDSSGFSGDSGQAILAKLYNPIHTASDKFGNLYIADDGNNRVRKVDIHGVITTIVGTGAKSNTGDGGLTTAATINTPTALAFDDTGNLYICSYMGCTVRKINTLGIITTIAGTGFPPGFSGDGGKATSAKLGFPRGVVVDDSGNVYIADQPNDCVRKVNAKTGIINTIAGIGTSPGYMGDNGPATSAELNYPTQLALDRSGNLYIADLMNNVIRKVDNKGIITTFAGNGNPGYSGNNGPAKNAEMHNPTGVAVDKAGNVYIADAYCNCTRKVGTNDTITVIAGTGTAGHTGDGGPALSAEMNGPIGISADTLGNIYLSEYSVNSDIRKLYPNCSVPLSISPVSPSYCSGLGTTLTASGAKTYTWSPSIGLSATTGSSVTASPSITTTYTVTATDSTGCMGTGTDVFTIKPSPMVSFNYTINGSSVSFNSDSSTGGTLTYSWNFGDSTPLSDSANPHHTFSAKDTFNVCLTLFNNSNCSFTLCKNVDLLPSGVINVVGQGSVQLYPNPAQSELAVAIGEAGSSGQLAGSSIEIIDVLGRMLLVQNVTGNQTIINVGNLSAGVYLLEVRTKEGLVVKKFVKE